MISSPHVSRGTVDTAMLLSSRDKLLGSVSCSLFFFLAVPLTLTSSLPSRLGRGQGDTHTYAHDPHRRNRCCCCNYWQAPLRSQIRSRGLACSPFSRGPQKQNNPDKVTNPKPKHRCKSTNTRAGFTERQEREITTEFDERWGKIETLHPSGGKQPKNPD